MSPATAEPAPPSRRAWIAVAILIIIVAIATAAIGARDQLERRRLLARAAHAVETRDLAELEDVERELDEMFNARRDRLPPRRDGIVNQLGAARERVRDAIAEIRSSSR